MIFSINLWNVICNLVVLTVENNFLCGYGYILFFKLVRALCILRYITFEKRRLYIVCMAIIFLSWVNVYFKKIVRINFFCPQFCSLSQIFFLIDKVIWLESKVNQYLRCRCEECSWRIICNWNEFQIVSNFFCFKFPY